MYVCVRGSVCVCVCENVESKFVVAARYPAMMWLR